MMRCSSQVFAFALMFIAISDLACVQAAPAPGQARLRKVNVKDVETNLQASLAELLSGKSASAARRLAAIEASVWQTFQALPKNAVGRLAPPAVRYVVHGYFAKEHGWQIKGLEPHGMQMNHTQVHDVSILQDKVPLLVENLLEVRQADRGLALDDVVAMIAVLEQLVFNESVTFLEAAYRLNSLSMENDIDEATLHRVLQSYLILFGQGSQADLFSAEHMQAVLDHHARPEIEEFERDAAANFAYAHRHQMNPFKPNTYSFQAVSKIMEDLALQYGKWQNAECRDMQAHLSELDPEGHGRVPLSLFYAQSKGPSAYTFSESPDYLRKIGALDESSASGPQVLIANYVAGPSNCIASSSYYSVCCLSQCEGIFSELEHHVRAPTASPERLLTLVRNMSDVQLKHNLPEKLHAIAAQHGGEVPLHGRLFAQWLHFAFPRECPYPSVVESATALTASQWLNGQSAASEEEREIHLATPIGSPSEKLNIEELWSEEEVLPVHDHTASSSWTGAGIVRTLVQIAAVFVALRAGHAAWQGGKTASLGGLKKNDDFVLPLHGKSLYV